MAGVDGSVRYQVVIDDSNVSSDAKKSEKKIDGAFSGLKSKAGKTAKVLGGVLGTAAIGVGVAAIKSADDMDKAMNQFIASTGKGADEAERYQEVLEGIYTNNYGESFEDIAQKMGLVNQQMGDLSDEELKRVTEQAYLLQDTFETDFSESLRGVNALTKQFGITSDEAFNLLAQGMQQGLNQNDDLADQLAEYSVYYADLGISAEQAFNIMANSAKDGVYQLDYINDAIKEFGIRSKDGSDASMIAFENLGYSAEEMLKTFGEGGEKAQQAMFGVVESLSEIEDPIKRNEIGVALFGTKFEDLGEDAILAITDINKGIDSSKNKLEEMEKIKYGSTSEMLEGLKRSLEPVLIDLGQELIPVLKDVVTALMPIVKDLLPIFSNVLMQLIPPLGELINALLPVLTEVLNVLIPPLMEIVLALMPLLVEVINLLLPIITILIGLVGEIIAEFVNFIAPLIEVVSAGLTPLLQALGMLVDFLTLMLKPVILMIQGLFQGVFLSIVEYASNQVQRIVSIFTNLIDFFKNIFTGNIEGAFKNLLNILGNILGGMAEMLVRPINIIIGAINGMLSGLDGIKIPDWVPKIGGKDFSFGARIPKISIPKFANGGLAYDETLAMVGDNVNASVDPEVIAPLSKLEAILGFTAARNESKVNNFSVVVTGNTISSENIDSIGNDFMRKIKREGIY